MNISKRLKFLKKILFYVLVLIILVITLIPVFWIINNSFKTRNEIIASKPVWFPKKPTMRNYDKIFFPVKGELSGWNGIRNSIIVASSSTILALIFGSMAAYSFSRFDFKGKDNIAFWALSTRMFPPAATVVPIFRIFTWLGLIDTHLSLTIAYLVFNLPFALWMMRGFFNDIPREIDECAMVDGCGRLRALWQVVMPMALPGIATTAIFCFLFSWNEFLFSMILGGQYARTLPASFPGLVTPHGTYWGQLCAAAGVVTVPIIILAAILQRYLIRGLSLGAVKG